MFLYLSKILPPLVYPLGLACLLVLLALLLRRQRFQRLVLLLALALLMIASNRWVALGLARSLEWRYLPNGELPQAEAIIVLGGGTLSSQYPRPIVEVDQAGDRLIYAAQLYHQGKAERLLLSGGRVDWISAGNPPAEDMAALLELLGVPRQAMWLESESRNTYENAANARALLQPLSIRRVILVTSAAHMPRALALFEKQGFQVIPAPTDFTVTFAGWQKLQGGGLATQLLAFLPSAENLALTTRMLKEYLGMLVYRLNGWI